jgi:bacillithiol system protein YtxJ
MADPSDIQNLASDSDLDAALDASREQDVVLYKHSSTCPISARAQDEMKALAGNGGPPIYEVVVQHARDVSDEIEDEFGIRHETPQAILVRDGEATFDTSHDDVTEENVRSHLSGG